MPAVIDNFREQYWFLSNFSSSPLTWNGTRYPTVEHAFQAAKTDDQNEKIRIAKAATPAIAKRLGRQATLRKDWTSIRVDIMRLLIEKKFQDPYLRQQLLATGDAKLIEGNTWGDRFWGVYNGDGENWLGRILMEERFALQELK